jgi:hypothetical protein
MGEYEQRAMIGTAKNDIDRTFRYIDLANLFPRRVVHKYLSVCNEDIPFEIDCHALTTAFRKGL